MRTVVALGGNALQRPGGLGHWAEAVERMRATVPALVALVGDGHDLVLTHGNGPQVGQLLREGEIAGREVPPRPMPVLGAETQGQIGGLIQQELGAALTRARLPRTVLTVISQVRVERRDPAFRRPSKPVGREYTEAEARLLRKREGWTLEHDVARGGWRRVVPSPRPVEWIEGPAVRAWLDAPAGRSVVPVVAGGGGIPVFRDRSGRIEGVDAVIDKDRTAALVAQQLGAETLAIVTDVPAAAVGFGRTWERWLGAVSKDELARFQAAGEFAEGSMGPKVEAGLSFLAGGGRRFLITDIPSLPRALRGEAGTRVEG
ncbi:MAG TPA: carbamate kinase [Thermoplasmata archaeon]|nr:carbamate kinase [Thermoplasmata archaeon]